MQKVQTSAKKSSLVYGKSPAHKVEYVSEQIFLISKKTTNKQKRKQVHKKIAKETKEENKITVQNLT